jgi:hypothetical protein
MTKLVANNMLLALTSHSEEVRKLAQIVKEEQKKDADSFL